MKDFGKGALVSIGVFLILGIIGWITISQVVVSPEVLDPSAAAGVVDESTAYDDPFAGGAVAPSQGQIDTYLKDIGDALFKGVITVAVAGFACAFLWFMSSSWAQRSVVGPSGQANAFGYWVLFSMLFLGACAAAYFFWIEPLGFGDSMNDVWQYATFLVSVLIGLLGYWLATALAASPVMKPSVPLASRFAPF